MLFLFIKAQLGNLVNKGKKIGSLDRARYAKPLYINKHAHNEHHLRVRFYFYELLGQLI
jgi:hypothetical protein